MIAWAVTAIIRPIFHEVILQGRWAAVVHTQGALCLLCPGSPQDTIIHTGATKNHSAANEPNVKHLQSDMHPSPQRFETVNLTHMEIEQPFY